MYHYEATKRLTTKMTHDKEMECRLTFYVDYFVNNTQLYHSLYIHIEVNALKKVQICLFVQVW